MSLLSALDPIGNTHVSPGRIQGWCRSSRSRSRDRAAQGLETAVSPCRVLEWSNGNSWTRSRGEIPKKLRRTRVGSTVRIISTAFYRSAPGPDRNVQPTFPRGVFVCCIGSWRGGDRVVNRAVSVGSSQIRAGIQMCVGYAFHAC